MAPSCSQSRSVTQSVVGRSHARMYINTSLLHGERPLGKVRQLSLSVTQLLRNVIDLLSGASSLSCCRQQQTFYRLVLREHFFTAPRGT